MESDDTQQLKDINGATTQKTVETQQAMGAITQPPHSASHGRARILWAVLAFIVLVAASAYIFACLHPDKGKLQQSKVTVEVITHYELLMDGKKVLDFEQDTVKAMGYFADKHALLPSCKGRIISNFDTTIWQNKYKGQKAEAILKCMTDSLDSVYADAKWKVSELTYYLHSHNVTDEGYNMISQYAQKETVLRDSAKKMLDSLTHVAKGKNLQLLCKHDVYAMPHKQRLQKLSNRLFQLASQETPDGVKAIPSSLATSLTSLNVQPLQKMPTLYFHIDSCSNYLGAVDSVGMPHGHGKWLDLTNGTYYEGNWKHGKRNGFGYSLAKRKTLRVGEWQNDTYRGEKLVYSSDRIYGIDISKYQHVIGKKKYSIDWSRLRITHLGNISHKKVSGAVNFPIRFVYIKSTEGASLLNPYYRKDYAAARAHGFRVGTYHFFTTISPAGLQAKQFLKHTMVRKGDLPPVLDVEPTREQIKKMGGTGVLFARVRTWLRIVERNTGMKPILYISQTFVNRYLNQAPDLKHNYHIWIARYGEYKPDIHLVYWQLCPDGRVAGIHGAVDINVFNGYQDAYDKFVKEHAL